jgi:hypothetical protein
MALVQFNELVEAMNCLASLRKHSGNSPEEVLVRVNTHLIEMQVQKMIPAGT